jgi:hypothetical protein
MSEQIAVQEFTGLLDIQTGELLPATVDNAARVLNSCRDMKERINRVIDETTAYLAQEAATAGTKTLRSGAETVTLTGGESVEYDAADLMEALAVAGCPDARIAEAVVAEITYKINRSVLRQLAAANPDYKAAIELAARTVTKPWRASVKFIRRETQ